MKHVAIIQLEFLKKARNWDDLSYEEQKAYISRHPKTKRRITARYRVGDKVHIVNSKGNKEPATIIRDLESSGVPGKYRFKLDNENIEGHAAPDELVKRESVTSSVSEQLVQKPLKKSKFTFKTEKPTGKWRSFAEDHNAIKFSGKEVGLITSKPHRIKLMVEKADIMEDKNPNCSWKWITLKPEFNTIDEAKNFIINYADAITSKWELKSL